METPPQNRSGLILLDKPIGMTSRQAVDLVQERLSVEGLGHAGTLDPLASGLLVVLVGRLRRFQDHFLQGKKTYCGTIRFGARSSTEDGEGERTESDVPVPNPLADALARAIPDFVGCITQKPPLHSAVRVAGKRAYALVRAGKKAELAPREVTITALEVLECKEDLAAIRLECSAGTYVRSLARDLGEALGCGAYLSGLRRTASGALRVQDARAPEAVSWEDLRPIEDIFRAEGRIDFEASERSAIVGGWPIALRGRVWPEAHSLVFGWIAGRIQCRLTRLDGDRVRSSLYLGD